MALTPLVWARIDLPTLTARTGYAPKIRSRRDDADALLRWHLRIQACSHSLHHSCSLLPPAYEVMLRRVHVCSPAGHT